MSNWQQLAQEFGTALGAAVDVAAEADPEIQADPHGDPTPSRPAPVATDTFPTYTQLRLADGRVLRRYDTGSVRVENLKSGVIQEERGDGSLLVSLPSARLIFQECPGEPVLLYDLDTPNAQPGIVRVATVAIPGETQARPVFHFKDQDGEHLVELESLRYFRVRRSA